MSCSSSGTTMPGSRKLAWNSSMSWVAASTSSYRARYHGPGRRARDRAAGAELLEPGRVAGRAQRIEGRHARILAPSARLGR